MAKKPAEVKPPKRRWPTHQELISWALFDFLDTVGRGEPTPSMIQDALKQFNQQSPVELHQYLHQSYQEFRDLYLFPAE